MTYRSELVDLARHRHGVVTTREAREWGIPAVEMRKMAQHGGLTRLGHGIYRVLAVAQSRLTPYAVTLAFAGPDGVLNGETTLGLLRIIDQPPMYRACTPWLRRCQAPGYIAFEHCYVEDAAVSVHHGMRGLSVPRALQWATLPRTLRRSDVIAKAYELRLITLEEGTRLMRMCDARSGRSAPCP